MKALCILFILNLFRFVSTLHLNGYQLTLINNLIQNPLLQNKERERINLILYAAYEKWAIKKAYDFKTLHKYKCRHIQNEELVLSSKVGLFKSITKYNGKHSLTNYSSIYVNSELLKLLTEKHALSVLPKKYRIKNKANFSKTELKKYNYLLNTKLSSQYEDWQIDLIFVNKEDILSKIIQKNQEDDDIYNLLNSTTIFSKRFIYLKYYLHRNKVLSNAIVSELMCCSEETIRKHLIDIKQTANTL